ncbi:YifB family Mg chelatase-like AAA ATPase [Corynebacterium tapiri]|uniref:YifB family Mg chelatase-like AAA ATPase n=1 Tax=Corynebacterium tapiri TaxID=1448266 RepID=A0A5C4U556_9CORY|nr:YifB family Mg chelatase-like AAA ATPase [Corynebacterium tapiri]TNL99296.1 YifB family Mg chelatase-like AAA ATPase [Corynebacterium tapiri]
MALGRSATVALEGVEAHLVRVEAHVGAGLPGIQVVGLGDAAVKEAKHRLRSAVANVNLQWPKTKITVSLSPADVPKRGAHFDLALCLAILSAGHTEAMQRLEHTVVLGELGLDGHVRAVPGILPAALAARDAGYTHIVVPVDCAAEAALATGIEVIGVPSLTIAWAYVCGSVSIPSACPESIPRTDNPKDFADVAGQASAKKAAEVAAAGAHHMLLIGPPGSGKSMIAERMPGILPDLTQEEALEVCAVRSITGAELSLDVPFCAPHHSVKQAGLIGGGSRILPGAVTLAHRGVLFLDEASEIPSQVLDCLRTPLQDGRVVLRRGVRSTELPADFQLILAANPCACGAEDAVACTCRPQDRRRHLSNLSGPLLDRIDITAHTATSQTAFSTENESSSTIAERVLAARERAYRRWEKMGVSARANSRIPGPVLRRNAPADDVGMAALAEHVHRGTLTQRGIDRALALAWTLADLAEEPRPNLQHIFEAVSLRGSHELA